MAETPNYYRKLAMVVPSNARMSEYGWLRAMPRMREWIGDRVIHQIEAKGMSLVNRDFEATVSVKRNDIEDDNLGSYAPMFTQMGAEAARHPDSLALPLLKNGFAAECYDGQYFFDADHPVGGVGDAPVASVSNFGGGSGTAWFLLDCSQAIKPLIYQERMPYKLDRLDNDSDESAFMRGEYLYGVRARCNAGYGLWQFAFGSKQTLDSTSYAAARAAMMGVKKDNGEPLNVRPTHLVVPPSLEAAALAVVKADRDAAGAANVWAGTAEVIVTPYVG